MRKTLLILMTFAMMSATVHFGINDETFVDNDGTVTFDVMFSIDNGEELAGFQFNLLPAGAIDFSDATIVAGQSISGWVINASDDGTFLGFDFAGSIASATEGILFTVTGAYDVSSDGSNVVLTAEEDSEGSGNRLVASGPGGVQLESTFWSRNWTVGSGALDVNDAIINTYSLSDNYPNPFNPTTNISFSIESYGEASLLIYDALGREVKSLVSGLYVPGAYTVTWNGTDNNGNEMSSGMYFYKFTSGDFTKTKKMLFVK
jgi:hypothetical protein